MLDLTIAIPVKNEEVNLPGCLEAIGTGLAKRIVVIDSDSVDRTKEVAREFGAEVVNFNWDGRFPKKRNWFLRMHPPNTRWILFLDADELLTESFKVELRRALQRDDMVGYWLSYSVYFLGKRLKGGYPLHKLALFRVGAGEYEHIEEENWSSLDMEVHEHPVLEGKVGFIRSKIDHRDYRGMSDFVIKHEQYASWEAARFLKLSEGTNAANNWTWKQSLKYRLMDSVFIGPLFFLGSYLFWGGFRDGASGFAYAVMRMSYYTQVYCKIQDSRNKKKYVSTLGKKPRQAA